MCEWQQLHWVTSGEHANDQIKKSFMTAFMLGDI